MHCSFTLHFISCGYLSLLPSFSLSLEHLPMAPKKSTTPICNLVSHASSSFPPFLILFSLMTRTAERHSKRTSLYIGLMLSVRLFCLSCQTQQYPKLSSLVGWSSYVNDSLHVQWCMFRSFTPTYTSSVPPYPCSLQVFKVHVSL